MQIITIFNLEVSVAIKNMEVLWIKLVITKAKRCSCSKANKAWVKLHPLLEATNLYLGLFLM